MQFAVIARDGPNALDKRMLHRPAHLGGIQNLVAAGKWLDGGAMLGGDGGMIGSIVFYEVADRAELDVLLANEIFVQKGVWIDLEIVPFRRTKL